MRGTIDVGAILIKDGALLPKELQIESEPCVPGWRLVNDFDGHGLDRAVREAEWTFFCLAGEIGATSFGIDEQSMIRRAIKRIAAKARSKTFNGIEITRVVSKRFLGVPYLSVGAQSRHIQETLFLFSSEGIRGTDETELTAARAKTWGVTSAKEFAYEGPNARADVATTPRS